MCLTLFFVCLWSAVYMHVYTNIHMCESSCLCRCTYMCVHMCEEVRGPCRASSSIGLHLVHWGRVSLDWTHSFQFSCWCIGVNSRHLSYVCLFFEVFLSYIKPYSFHNLLLYWQPFSHGIFSSRMSTEQENTEMHLIECMLKHFKTQKVAISNVIRSTFPFLESLRDHEFITGKMYEVSKFTSS